MGVQLKKTTLAAGHERGTSLRCRVADDSYRSRRAVRNNFGRDSRLPLHSVGDLIHGPAAWFWGVLCRYWFRRQVCWRRMLLQSASRLTGDSRSRHVVAPSNRGLTG